MNSVTHVDVSFWLVATFQGSLSFKLDLFCNEAKTKRWNCRIWFLREAMTSTPLQICRAVQSALVQQFIAQKLLVSSRSSCVGGRGASTSSSVRSSLSVEDQDNSSAVAALLETFSFIRGARFWWLIELCWETRPSVSDFSSELRNALIRLIQFERSPELCHLNGKYRGWDDSSLSERIH